MEPNEKELLNHQKFCWKEMALHTYIDLFIKIRLILNDFKSLLILALETTTIEFFVSLIIGITLNTFKWSFDQK